MEIVGTENNQDAGFYMCWFFKQKVELNFQNSEVELLQDSLALVTPWANILPMPRTRLSLLRVAYA